MESENPLLLLLPLYLMTLNVSCEQFISLSIGLCQIWNRSNQPEIFLESKMFEKIFDIHLLYHVYIIPGFNG